MDDDRLHKVPRPDESWLAGRASHDTADMSAAEEPALDHTSQRVATLVREVELPAAEVAAAKERSRARLRAAMNADDAPAPLEAGRSRRARPSRRLTVIAAAAFILLSLSGGISLSSAAAGALASSPLYGLKRAEEWVALHTAWSDQRRGEVLVEIAQHRLSEAAAEASLGHATVATALSGELKDTVLQVIHLTASMSSKHEDTRIVSAGLVGILAAESSAQATAAQAGDMQLAQALQQVRADEANAIANLNVQLPPGAPGPTDGPGQTPPAGGASQTPGSPGQGGGPTPLATPQGAPTRQPTPTTDADGQGHGENSPGGHGKPTPTPSGTPGTGRGNTASGGTAGGGGATDGGNSTGNAGHPYAAVAGSDTPPARGAVSLTVTRSGSNGGSSAAGKTPALHAASDHTPALAPVTTSTRGHTTQPQQSPPPLHAKGATPSGSKDSGASATHTSAATSARPSFIQADAHGSSGGGWKAKP